MTPRCGLAVLLLVVQMSTLVISTVDVGFEPKDYCIYGEDCWPSIDVFRQLGTDHPSLEVVLRDDAGWDIASDLVLNRRVTQVPGATVYVTTAEDVKTVINFTQTHNLDLKIISSGHEFIGRNIAEGCLLLSVARMVETKIDLNCPENDAGCMTVEPGVWWLQAYREVDLVNRTILGGEEPSVSVTGWALGGGHSPYSPKIGLGADQIVELSMVLADLSLVTLNKDELIRHHLNGSITTSNDTSLFWAVRGGGGGTFGVVTSIKYRLHMPPSKFTTMICAFAAIGEPKTAMQNIKKSLRPVIADFPDEFGGYILTGTYCYETEPECKMAAHVAYIFTHYGARAENEAIFNDLDRRTALLSPYYVYGPCNTTEYDSYFDFVLTQANDTYVTADLDGTFLSPSEYNNDFIDGESEILESAFNDKKEFTATWIKLGGQTRNDSSGATAINPLFRNAMWTIAYLSEDPALIQAFNDLVDRTVAVKGQYYSECDDDLELSEWQNQFWGADTYSKLLSVKRKYDPHNQFNCKMCVGSLSGALPDNITLTVDNIDQDKITPSVDNTNQDNTTPSGASSITGAMTGICFLILFQKLVTKQL